MRPLSIVLLLVSFGYLIYYKYIRTPDNRKLSFLDDFSVFETTVDHYYSGREYAPLVVALILVFLIETAGTL